MTWTIGGIEWTGEEIRRAAEMAKEQASIESLRHFSEPVQLSWLSRARGMMRHEALVDTPEYVPIKMPAPRDLVEEAGPPPVEGLQTGPRLAMKDEIPRSAMTMWNSALKNGWWCYLTYTRGSWTELDGDLKIIPALQVAPNGDVEETQLVGMVEVILLRGKKAGQKFQASWVKKPWTKDAAYKFQAGHFWPDGDGLVPSPELTKRIKGTWTGDLAGPEEES